MNCRALTAGQAAGQGEDFRIDGWQAMDIFVKRGHFVKYS